MTETACANLVRLRKKSIEQGDKGDPETRDKMNRMFLYELEKVVCSSLIGSIDDAVLRLMYKNWTQAILDGAVEEQDRHQWMCSWVVVMAVGTYQAPALVEPTQQSNVVNFR